MIRTLWVWLNLLVATVPLGLIVSAPALFGVRNKFLNEDIPRFWATWLLWASGTPVSIEGAENLAVDRPQIIAANHESWYDIFALAAHVPKRYRFVAKKELERVPFFGPAWKVSGHISIDRKNRASAIRSLDRAGELIRGDNSAVIIFPEGTRTTSDRMLPFKKGAFMLALHAGVEIVPTAIVGTRRIHRKGGWRIRSGPIILRFGEPVSMAGYSEENRDELVELIRSRIESLRGAPTDERARRAS